MPILHSEDENSDEEDYDSESESDSENEDSGRMLKPVFVRKENRVTIKDQENKLLADEALLEKKKIIKEERKSQTRVLVAESIRRTEEMNDAYLDDADSDAGLPDDADDVDDEMEVMNKLRIYVRLLCLICTILL